MSGEPKPVISEENDRIVNLGGFSYLQLPQTETPSSSGSPVILDRRASHHRSEFVDGSRGDGCGFGETVGATAGLAAGLLEVYFDSSLPVLVEVPVGDDVVVFDRLGRWLVGFIWAEGRLEREV
jgi:hypothetical protein